MSITKSLSINNKIKFQKLFIYKKKIIIQITDFNYFFITEFYKFSKQRTNIILDFNKKKSFLNKYKFFLKFCKWLIRSNVLTLFISGVGYKFLVQSKDNISFLDCNFGFSHKLQILIPKNINISIKKKKLIAKSYNISALGNFLARLKLKRPRNVYTGQGFWLKQESSNFKFKIMKR